MKNEQDILNTLKNVTLTAEERSLLHTRLGEYRALKPLPENVTLPGRMRSPFSVFDFGRSMPALASFFILVFVGGGVAQAAERAVPGDLLYPVKTAVNEEVRVAFAGSPEAQADVEAWRAERRLEEAQQLAVKESLTEERKDRLEENFDAHALRVEERIALISENDPVLATELASRFEASLTAHEAILASLETEKTESVKEKVRSRLAKIGEAKRYASVSLRKSSDDSPNTRMFAAEVSLKTAAPEVEVAQFSLMAETDSEDDVSASATLPPTEDTTRYAAAAERMRSAAKDALEKTGKIYQEKRAVLSSEQQRRVELQLATARDRFSEAERMLQDGFSSEAFFEFERVLFSMNTLNVLLNNDTSRIDPPRLRIIEIEETHDDNDEPETYENEESRF
ncbi:MAG: DUF5667 domain-containing protein [Patescibacteria group bacterium]